MSLLVAALGAVAFALPPPVLGPDGPVWAGPVAPGSAEAARWSAVVGLDIRAGAPVVEVETGAGLLAWTAAGWSLQGAPLRPPEVVGRADWDIDPEGELVAVRSKTGARLRFLYGAGGALSGVLLPGGGQVRVQRGPDGDAVALAGPGAGVWTLDRRAPITVRGPDGAALTLRVQAAEGTVVEAVEDALGRTASVEWEGAAAARRPRVWTDPAGARTTLAWEGSRVRVESGPDVWVLVLEGGARVRAVTLPSGRTWSWEYDAAGSLHAVQAPTGQRTVWERRPDGVHVATAAPDGTWVWERDDAGRLAGWTTPAGGRVQLHRDRAGRLIGGTDAVGNRIVLARDARGRPTGLVERDGARWALEVDGAGRLRALTDPTGRALRLDRDAVGRLVAVRGEGDPLLRLSRSAAGHLTEVRSADGAATRFLRDALGRLIGADRADGLSVRVRRDARGEVVAVDGPGAFRLSRDHRGRPTAAGTARFGWSPDGLLLRVERGGVAVTVSRDAAGRAAELRAGDAAVLRLGRDGGGRIVRWEDGARVLRVARDAVGLVLREEGDAVLEYRRDAAGRVSAVRAPAGAWEVATDAAGRTLVIDGPGPLDLGVDRDAAGLPALVRAPGGALFSRRQDHARAAASWMDRNGRAVWAETVERGPWGEARARVGLDGTRHRLRRDPLGEVVVEESAAGARWSRTAEALRAEGGWVLRDGEGGWAEALVPAGAAVWGLGAGVLSAARGPDGRLEAVEGPEGAARLVWDAWGRLAGVRGPTGADWRVEYDPRGRPSALRGPGAPGKLRWADLGFGLDVVEAGAAVPVLSGPFGPAAQGGGAGIEVWLRSPDGRVQAVQAGRADPAPVPWALPEATGALFVGGGAALFAGGPIVGPGTPARDPLGGARLGPTGEWSWALDPAGALDPWADPAPWAAQSPFADPLALALALSGVFPVGATGALSASTPDLPVEGLPLALGGGGSVPWGPDPAALPTDADLWEGLVLRALLPGARPMAPGDPLAAALRDELAKEIDLPMFPVVGLGRIDRVGPDGAPWGLANPAPGR